MYSYKKKVFCIGAHKTGTTSLTNAFIKLGYNPMPESIAYKYLHRDFNELITFIKRSKYNFFEDIPFNLFDNYKLLDKAFPSAKFILTVRDEKRWFESIYRWNKKLKHPQIYKTIYECDITANNRTIILNKYIQRNNNIKTFFFDKNNLLIMNICDEDGWNILCPFLGIQETTLINEPFIHTNKNDDKLCALKQGTKLLLK